MFSLHSSIAKLTIVQTQHLLKYKRKDRLNDWSDKKNRGAHPPPEQIWFWRRHLPPP